MESRLAWRISAFKAVHVATATELGVPFSRSLPPGIVMVQTSDLWIVKPVNELWTVAYRIALQDGFPVIAEMRIHPKEPGTHPGEWSAEAKGLRAEVPRGGMTATIARLANPGADVIQQLPEILDGIRRRLPAFWEALRARGVATSEMAPRRRQRQGGRRHVHSTREIAEVAQAYAKACASGSKRPIQDVARMLGKSSNVVRILVNTARSDLKFLSPTIPGLKGGVLTDAGRAASGTPTNDSKYVKQRRKP